MDMYNWIDRVIYGEKRPLPVLTYPAVQMLMITVKELVDSSSYQAMGMRLIADKYNMLAAPAYMDLSVEAEAFGAHCVYGVDEVPTIIGKLIADEDDADALRVPDVGAGRTGVCIDTIRKACKLINDRPVFAGCIGPFSLAGRLMNVNDIMVSCYTDPETVHKVLLKATEFIIKYVKELKKAGANAVIMAEPLAGILSPDLMSEFSSAYVKQIVDEVQDKHFLVIYHNCGNAINQLVDQMIKNNAHFSDEEDKKRFLNDALALLLEYRNLAAHGGRVYNHDPNINIRNKHFSKISRLQLVLSVLSHFKYDLPFTFLNKAINTSLDEYCHLYPNDADRVGKETGLNIHATAIAWIGDSNILHIDPRCSGAKNLKRVVLTKDIMAQYALCKKCCKEVKWVDVSQL